MTDSPGSSGKASPILSAQLDWSADGAPLSRQFDDIYFSRQNGLEETAYVFLKGNALQERFSRLALAECPRLCIGETGFGTGLNFLSAWSLRDQIAPSCQLHFVSVEKFPLTLEDLVKALSLWPELNAYSTHLIAAYPSLTAGWHHLSFCEHQVELNLYLGDALAGYEDYQAGIDAWFLDGFAPAKNPPMWSQALFREIARLSRQGATFSTFTAASAVREGLKSAGFTVQRSKGFGNKRHMLTGIYPAAANQNRGNLNAREIAAPWFITNQYRQTDTRSAAVLGGGLAGASVAYSLARRGWRVSLYERNQKLGDEASGNRQGILYNKLSAEPSISSDFYSAGYLYSQRQFAQLQTRQEHWQACGVLQLAYDEQEGLRQARFMVRNPQPRSMVLPVSARQASEIAGVPLDFGGLYFPTGGWAAPSEICHQQARHPNIGLQLGVEIEHIDRDRDAWLLFGADEKLIACTKVLVIANASGAKRFKYTKGLPLKAIRGQITHIPANPHLSLKAVLCGKGYIGPAIEGSHHIGATFNLNCLDTACRPSDHQINLAQLAELAPALAAGLNLSGLDVLNLEGRVGFRCTTPDYLPLVGPVPDQAAFLEDYGRLRNNAQFQGARAGAYLAGLYVSLGHGSKGLTSCPLAGELIAAYLNHEPFPIATKLTHALNPGRFLIRALKRNKI